jgi:hypothetical protein
MDKPSILVRTVLSDENQLGKHGILLKHSKG